MSTTDPDEWGLFVERRHYRFDRPPLRIDDPPPHTLDDCIAAAGAHDHSVDIRLRLAEAILAADGIPLVDSLSAFMERVGRVVVGVAAVVETGEEQLADWEREAAEHRGAFRRWVFGESAPDPAPDAGDTTEATG